MANTYGYARVSSADQNEALADDLLLDAAAELGVEFRLVFHFAGIDSEMRLEGLSKCDDCAEAATRKDAVNGHSSREKAFGLLQPESAPFLVDGSTHDFAIANVKQTP